MKWVPQWGIFLFVGHSHKLDVDKFGAIAGTLCAIHCLLSGVALGLLSTVGLGFIATGLSEVIFLTVTFSIGLFGIWFGYRRHRSWVPSLFFVAGLLMILGAHAPFGSPKGLDDHTNPVSVALAVLGACCLVAFHFMNQRWKPVSRG